MSRKSKGFRIGKRILRISSWIHRYRTRPEKLSKPIVRLKNWGKNLKKRIVLFGSKFGSGYKRIRPDPVPKGHLAVYVGQKDGDFHRVLVPIVYFNHPLFGELLNEAEKEYGFCHEGGITIPCRYSDFERVKTRIDSGSGSRIFPWIYRRN